MLSCSTTGATTGGVLAQIIALGAADTHLTADPDVSFWRLRVNKCTNFAMESILQTFTGSVAWGSQMTATIARTGDLVYWMYVLLDIPAIAGVAVASGSSAVTGQFPCADPCDPCGDGAAQGECSGTATDDVFDTADVFDDDDNEVDDCTGLIRPYAHWVNEIGHAAIACANFSIGGQIVDTVYSYFMHAWEELSGQPGKRLEEMIGKRYTVAQLVADSQYARRLYVPLPFYFTRTSGNAMPMVSLQFHSMKVNVTLSNLNKMIQTSDCDVSVVKCKNGQVLTNQDVGLMLDITYCYLDMAERDRFAVGSFQQLIHQTQHFSTTHTGTTMHAQLNFNHPCMELIWMVQRKCQAEANNTFNFSGYQGRDPIVRACLKLNNLTRFDREGQYFRQVVPYERHAAIPRSFVYCYCFSVQPESHQPGGSLNFSRIDNASLTIQLASELVSEEMSLMVFARSWNILRYKGGLGGLLYSN